ncbi:MAG TPA: hypothetical protein VK590_00010 [Saprospiraceae bacterium]|nr:hypothetical protein [Saprospiraceae bacterium]
MTGNNSFTDQQLMENIRKGGNARESGWQYISQHWGALSVSTCIKRTGCEEWLAKEAFSNACVGIDKRIRSSENNDFLVSATLRSYLIQAHIYAVFSLLKKESKTVELSNEERMVGLAIDELNIQDDCTKLMDKALENIGPRAKKILSLFSDGFSMEEIAIEMGFQNKEVAKREKYKCQESFKEYLKMNPSIKKQLIENCYG